MTQVKERTRERVVERPAREPPVRKAPPPKVPHPPRFGLPIRWIGWAAVVVVLGAVAVATWLAVSPGGGEEVATWDLYTQEREAGVEYTRPDTVYAGDLFTQQREASAVRLPDEAMSLLVLRGEPEIGFRWAGVGDVTLEEHLLTLQPDEAMSLLVIRGDVDVGFRWAGESDITLEEHLASLQPQLTMPGGLGTEG